MEQEILSKDMIPQPELWRCVIEMDESRLDVALFPPVETERLIHRTILLNPDSPSLDKAVQEAVYANPLLLSDFARIDVLVTTTDFSIVPAETAQSADAAQILTAACIDTDGKTAEMCAASPNCSIAFAIDSSLAGFIRRTFFNVRIAHSLAPLIAYPAEETAIFTAVERGKVLITAFENSNLLFANIFRCAGAEDATYFISAVSKNLPVENLPVVLAGNSGEADLTEEYLTKYICAPKRSTLPHTLARFGKDTTTLTQPLTAFLSCGL
ncbi:MAG: DUF3822 family protein [Paramuribaculum sp.]|nr:DUF3822 family protein [Paramuribaculum sp.]